MWIKAVTPISDIVKVSPTNLNEKGGIHIKNFLEEFNNLHKTSGSQKDSNIELHHADTVKEICTFDNDHNKKETDYRQIQEKDTFKCGICKAQFQALSAFIDHKRTQCDFVQMTDQKTDIMVEGNSLFSDIVLSSGNKLSANDPSYDAGNGNQELIELIDETVPPVLSFIVGNNQFVLTNPLEINELTNQFILSPTVFDKSELILNSPNAGNMITTVNHTEISDTLVLASTPAADEENNSGIIASEVTNNASLINIDQNLTSTENASINLHENMILAIHYENDNQTKTDKTDKSKTKLPCSYCGKVFEKPFNLQQHERVHTGERPFQCVICGRAFSQKANVRKHMMRHKVWPQAKQTLRIKVDQDQKKTNENELLDRTSYSCQYCSLSFSSYSLHKKHLTVHADFKVYRCIQKGCDATFSDLDDFLCHSESHSSAEFQCHVCLNVFTSLEELGAHQYDHDLPNQIRKDYNIKLKCEVCRAQFKSAESLKNHLAVDTHNYECPHCKSVFNCERFLRRHLATHSDPSQSKFECKFCNKTFRTQKYLSNHIFIHSDEKPFNCELCNKQFASKYRLKRHLAIHLSQYLECPFKTYLGCDKKFYRKDKLRNHIATHCHLKLKSCQICSKTFTSFAKLQQHMKREHKSVMKKKQIMKCLTCSQTFRKQKQLYQHHCTIGEKNFKSRLRNDVKNPIDEKIKDGGDEIVSNIEIIMVPYINDGRK